MGRCVSIVMIVVVVVVAMAVARGDSDNKSASVWSTVKEEGDLLAWDPEADDDLTELAMRDDEERQLDGGFSSLDGMLQWAIGHSDPAKLKEAALGIQHLSPEELRERQMEIKELMERLKTPSDAELMKIAIDDLDNSSLSLEQHQRALQELLILVEPIDNANDLHKLGGLTAIIGKLEHSNPQIRTTAAWVLGKACQNNPFVQNQVLELGPLAKLMDMTRSDFIEEATKALYAISALIRSNHRGQELFYMEAGDLMIQDILSNTSIDVRLRRKSVFLLADLIECQLDERNSSAPPSFSSHLLLKSVVNQMASVDLDLQEKALYAIKNLLLLRSANAVVFKDVCELDVALHKMEQQLQQQQHQHQRLISDSDSDDDTVKDFEFGEDMENLRREVEAIFNRELDKARQGRAESGDIYDNSNNSPPQFPLKQ
ncbi:hsp70 nucleotide exchange factor FES1 [Andrographis paniculata]|uniref:hsp70 nucleotide exchange factor FES1 n=1 Tax=Andrographis paniculata TaxID=175694 RepID=UPI0021E9198E|nr:hsp70 nucleotide exchange factor FES1 [Andrographis paniculata]